MYLNFQFEFMSLNTTFSILAISDELSFASTTKLTKMYLPHKTTFLVKIYIALFILFTFRPRKYKIICSMQFLKFLNFWNHVKLFIKLFTSSWFTPFSTILYLLLFCTSLSEAALKCKNSTGQTPYTIYERNLTSNFKFRRISMCSFKTWNRSIVPLTTLFFLYMFCFFQHVNDYNSILHCFHINILTRVDILMQSTETAIHLVHKIWYHICQYYF